PTPDLSAPEVNQFPHPGADLDTATHVLAILSAEAAASPQMQSDCARALDLDRKIILVLHEPCDIPARLQALPVVDFRDRFLLAVEDLVRQLKTTGAPTRPLTIEHAPPVGKPDLIPITLPGERCWRDDRLKINYILPMIEDEEELALRLPAFFDRAGFDLVTDLLHPFMARRRRGFPLFDPRRADHTLTVEPVEGALLVYYKMARTQAYFWTRSHFYVLDREAAALFRYLATGTLDDKTLAHVRRQARVARLVSWTALIVFWLAVLGIGILLYREFFSALVLWAL
ncbi:MAG: hypothetical protein JW910_18875, partial [Anaerolineae bacterium]|nr:hypothetical protein [Anaerolineae bacterium]